MPEYSQWPDQDTLDYDRYLYHISCQKNKVYERQDLKAMII